MVSTREIKGTREQIVEQIEHVEGRIVSAILMVEESAAAGEFVPPTDEEFAKLAAELDSLAVRAGHVDDSREAMYTRMPGE